MINRVWSPFLELFRFFQGCFFELVFCLDYNHIFRVGEDMSLIFEGLKCKKIMIDHHESPDDFATYAYCDPSMSSTCEIIYNFLSEYDKNLQLIFDVLLRVFLIFEIEKR